MQVNAEWFSKAVRNKKIIRKGKIMAQKNNMELKYVVVDGENHVADMAVCRYIDSLEKALTDEQTMHQKFVASLNADVNKQAERIALNLASGMQDSDNCLKYSLTHFDKTDPVTGEPIFAFQKEVLRRICMALIGKHINGTEYTQ